MSIRAKLIHLLGGRTDYECSLLERSFVEQPRIEETPYDIQTVCAKVMVSPLGKPPYDFIQRKLAGDIVEKLLSDGYISFMSDENDDEMTTSTVPYSVRAMLTVCRAKQ